MCLWNTVPGLEKNSNTGISNLYYLKIITDSDRIKNTSDLIKHSPLLLEMSAIDDTAAWYL